MAFSREKRRQPWLRWFSETDTPAERKLITKLDLLIVPYAFIAFWIDYIDSSNITNAYVAGLSTDLGFYGNELTHFQTIYNVGQVIGQLPAIWLFPILPMHWFVPGAEFLWGIFTLLQYRANSYGEFMAYRFMVGLLEAPFFGGVHYVLGAWYRGDEIGRRGGVFYVGLTLGSATAGLIQSGASANLDGVGGLAGWRWQFIIVALMTFVVAIAGFFVWPGTPDIPNKLLLSEEELNLARKRMEDDGNDNSGGNGHTPKITLSSLRTILSNWKFWVLNLWTIWFFNSDPQPWGGYLLWIKSLGRYSEAEVNRLGASSPALGILYVLFITFSSDLWLGRTAAIVLAHVVNIVSMTILVIWNVPESAKWFAYNIYFFDVGMSSVLFGWANDILRHNKNERAFVLVMMIALPTSVRAWIGNLVFQTVKSPRFTSGYSFCLANSIVLIGWTFLVRYLHNKEEKQIAAAEEQSSNSQVDEVTHEQFKTETQPGTEALAA